MAHLAELDRRRLYLGAGFSSLFTYCSTRLSLSEPEAYNRIEAARAVQRFPRILALLSAGSLNLTTLRLLARHLTSDNMEELLAPALGKSKREVKELLAHRFPQAPSSSSTSGGRAALIRLAAPREGAQSTARIRGSSCDGRRSGPYGTVRTNALGPTS